MQFLKRGSELIHTTTWREIKAGTVTDIVEIEGKPLAKRGKMSGSKRVFRCAECGVTRVSPASQEPRTCACGGIEEDILVPFVSGGDLQYNLPTASEIRDFVLLQLKKVEL
jgi:nicotinate phosphoribosyltransferase